MWKYQPPLRDMRYVIDEVLSLPERWGHLPAFAELDSQTAAQVLNEAARFAVDVLAPTNATGDLQGCTWSPDQVRTPAGFREAYRIFVQAGWPALACAPQFGGQGLPQVLNAALFEMLVSANHAWTMYPGLLHGAYDALRAHASAVVKALFLDKVVSGEWLATMCLTEAQAGSDLGLIKTRAESSDAGTFVLTGSKIYISGGDHDLTDNIVHLVLARLPGGPAGTKGISLFACPKFMPDGKPNAIRCVGIEKKMGIKGSATCAMSFEGATGWLIGEPHRGLAAMFPMMNSARLHVAIQGLAHAEASHQNAGRYAVERLQSRVAAPSTPAAGRSSGSQADPIALQPAMRRKLLRQRVYVDASRLMAYEAAHLLDVADYDEDRAQRVKALDHVSLLTPVLKAFLTANGFQIASDALQVFGGHGYIHDWGVEQCVRDSRIALIYEGTNEIQAIDLLVRKVLPDGAAKFDELLTYLQDALPSDGEHSVAASRAIARMRDATHALLRAAATDAELAFRVADDFLRAMGLVLVVQAWARCAAVSSREQHAHDAFHRAKCDIARHCFDYVLPELEHALQMISAGGHPLGQLPMPA